jgi:3-deoxy-D-manno-octulosonic-acid transferase
VMGPHTFNFAEAAELSSAAGAAIRVSDMNEGVVQALSLLGDASRAQEAAARSLGFAAEHRGAAQRMAQLIEGLMPERGVFPSPSGRG